MVKMKHIAIVGAAAVALSAMTASANLLTDPSFEDTANLGVNWNPFFDVGQDDWANGAPGVPNTNVGPYGNGNPDPALVPILWGQVGGGETTPQYGMSFRTWIGGTAGTGSGGFFQDNPATAGVTYTFGIDTHAGKNYGPAAATTELKIEWLVGGAQFNGGLDDLTVDIDSLLIPGTDPGSDPYPAFGGADPAEWQTWSISDTAPVGADGIRVVALFTGGTDVFLPETALRLDNATLIPEPGSLALLGLGTLVIAGMRRRMK